MDDEGDRLKCCRVDADVHLKDDDSVVETAAMDRSELDAQKLAIGIDQPIAQIKSESGGMPTK